MGQTEQRLCQLLRVFGQCKFMFFINNFTILIWNYHCWNIVVYEHLYTTCNLIWRLKMLTGIDMASSWTVFWIRDWTRSRFCEFFELISCPHCLVVYQHFVFKIKQVPIIVCIFQLIFFCYRNWFLTENFHDFV
jgi:hypothetical protein